GLDLKARVIKTTKVYNAAKQEWQYKEIELGQFKPNMLSQDKADKQAIKNSIDTQKSDLMKAIDNATNLITGNKGGYVVFRNNADGKPYEILIMDTPDIGTAQKVWRWNQSGLGYSSTGINGPYGLAMTIDGAIVADYITTGILNGNLIKAGNISSLDNTVSINLENGAFKIGGGSNDSEHTNSYSIWKHSDGSYTKVSANGMERYVGSTGSKYFSLSYTNFADILPATSTIATIVLPSIFKGKQFTVELSLRSIGVGAGMALAGNYIEAINFDYDAGTFQISADGRTVSFGVSSSGVINTYTSQNFPMQVSYLVLA
ncbi:hypothetical protein, partial [Rhodopseudomonas parapalustris]